MKRQRRNNHTLLLWIGIALIVAIILAIIIIFLLPFSYAAKQQRASQEPYDALEYNTVQQPRDVQEAYQDQEPYTRQDCQNTTYQYSAQLVGSVTTGILFYAGTIRAQVELTNQEHLAGNYTVVVAFFDALRSHVNPAWSEADMYSQPQTFALEPYETRTITTLWTAMKDTSTTYVARYQVTPPEFDDCKTVTDYRTVTKTRTVTTYVDVQQPHTVTKHRTVYEDVDIEKKDTLWHMITGKTQYYFPADHPAEQSLTIT